MTLGRVLLILAVPGLFLTMAGTSLAVLGVAFAVFAAIVWANEQR